MRMKKIFLTLIFGLVALTSFAQLRSEFIVFKDTVSGKMYLRRISPKFTPSGGGGDTVDASISIIASAIQGTDYTIKWKIGNIKNYVLQKSDDSLSWSTVATLPDSTFDSTFAYTDASEHWYRVYGILQDDSHTDTSAPVKISQGLAANEYFINDSVYFNTTPTTQSVPNTVELVGDPASELLTVTAPNGWGLRTTRLWNPDTSGTSATMGGEYDPLINDFGGFYSNDSAVVRSIFVADSTSFNGSNWNMEFFGLDPLERYIIQITGSITSTNTTSFFRNQYYVLNHGTTPILRELNTFSNTSWYTQHDTIQPDGNGIIKMMIGGVDSATGVWTTGQISGAKIWQVSKTDTSGYKISLQFFRDSAIIELLGRQALVYYPQHNYDPEKKYPILFYIPGAESSGNDVGQVRQYGLPRLEELGEDLYGLKANGDTVRFVVVALQYTTSEAGFSATEIHNICNAFKSNYVDVMPIDTANVYATGFSYGGGNIIRWAYNYPNDLKASAAVIPVSSGMSSSDLGSMAHVFEDDSVYLLLMPHNDISLSLASEVYDSISNHSPGFATRDVWYGRGHNGMNWQMDTSYIIPALKQTMLDYFVNPKANSWSNARFAFTTWSQASGRWDQGIISVRGTPDTGIVASSDPVSGITIRNIENGTWGGAVSSGITQFPDKYGTAFGFYAYQTCWYTSSGTYAANGANMRISGLLPNTQYQLTILGSTTYSDRWSRYGIDGSNFVDINNVNNQRDYGVLVATSDASGNIDWYVYSTPGHSGFGILNSVIISRYQLDEVNPH